jgi:putative nucleotidyltransferase with HDIG domain
MSKPLPPIVRAYVALVVAAGAVVIGHSVLEVWSRPFDPRWLLLLALTSLSSTFAIRIPNVSVSVSVAETFVFICALLFGPAPAALIIAVDGAIVSIWRRNRSLHRFLFNVAFPALSIFAAAHVFFFLAGISPGDAFHLRDHLGPLFTFTSVYFLLSSGLMAGVVSLHGGEPLLKVWKQHFGWILLNYFGAASVAALIVHDTQQFNPITLAIVVPLLVISYLTFKTSLARVEDANRHLQELNKLYLSTIETLAMAVDAKDQITHGHIRRVQAFAVGLAKELGVTDDGQVKAVEAAALLHDMGKLAIPEHILNKPGKLSPAEFEKMKKHASIGADILSAIDFPYPVVPIVRHHHEQWNGKGYPDGLAGSEIPIGARILSVVDCFDALTSDRPYRRALSDEEAIAILLEQRGTAYDPLVVDTFARVYTTIAPRQNEFEPHRRTLEEITAIAQPEPAAYAGAADTDPKVLPIFESLHSFSAQTVLADAVEELASKLRSLTPAALCTLFLPEASSGELYVGHASGSGAPHVRELRMAVGERLSGWVAANRRTICNSDAALDLAAVPELNTGEFKSCLATPLVAADTLAGVLTLYAREPQAYSDSDRRIVEQIARPLAHLVRGALELEKVQRATESSALAGIPPADQARFEYDPLEEPCLCPVAAVALQVQGMDQGGMDGTMLPEALLARAAASLRRDLRVADLLYRDGPRGLLAVLPHANLRAAETIAARAKDSLVSALEALEGDLPVGVRVVTGIGTAPADGLLLDHVMDAARRRASESAHGAAPLTSFRTDLSPLQPRLFDAEAVEDVPRAS